MSRAESPIADYARRALAMQIAVVQGQAVLSAQVLHPILRELLNLARSHRKRVDAALRADLAAGRPVPNAPGTTDYPIGFCFAICARVFQCLSGEPLVRGLVAAGVTWKPVYFIQENRLFQNAIQCGDHLLDVANNTCDPALAPVVCTPIEDLDWDNLRDYRQTAHVAERYYQTRIFPNRFFPLLFPVAPFLRLEPDGGIGIFWHEHMLFFLDINEGWPRAGALLDDAQWMTQPLPPEHAVRMQALQVAAAGHEPPPVELRESHPDELRTSLAQWDALHHLPAERLRMTIGHLDTRLRATARWLRSSAACNLRC